MTLPNFLVLGAQKAGTTSLYHYLGQHPQIFMSPVKEPHYFSYAGEDPRYMPDGTALITDGRDYESLFEGAEDYPARGEASPSYLYLPVACERIHRRLPEAKLIAVLRHPAERAWSNFLHNVRIGVEPESDFRRALDLEEERMADGWSARWHYRHKGLYADQLERYFESFGKDRLAVFLFDDLKRDPDSMLHSIFRFLDVEPSFQPDTSTRHTVSGLPRNRWVAGALPLLRRISRRWKPLVPAAVRRQIRRRLFYKPGLDLDLRAEMTREFREDIERVGELIGRDLSAWIEPR